MFLNRILLNLWIIISAYNCDENNDAINGNKANMTNSNVREEIKESLIKNNVNISPVVCQCVNEDWNSENINISTEKQLTKHLVKNYQIVGRGGRPVKDTSTTTHVTLMFGLVDLNLDENEKILTTSMWVFLSWPDEYLVWDPGEYKRLRVTRLEGHEIWTPDIMLYNTAEPDSKSRNSLAKVHYSGQIRWNRHQIFKSSCALDVIDFPFDTQICNLWFGSWTHFEKEIQLNFTDPRGIDTTMFDQDYGKSNEWNISQLVAKRVIMDGTPILTYELHLQRKMVFSSYILTMPCVFLATLTLVVFCLPPERPDRTGLGMSLFASFLVLLLILVEAAPSSASSVPKLGIYYCFNMVIIMMSIFLSSVVVNIHRTGKSASKVPKIVKWIFLDFLGRILFVKSCRSSITKFILSKIRGGHAHIDKSEIISNTDENYSLLGISSNEIDLNSSARSNGGTALSNRSSHCLNNTISTTSLSVGNSQTSALPNSVEYLLQENISKISELKDTVKKLLDYVCKKERLAAAQNKTTQEWQQLAKVVDRLMFLLYVAAIILSLIYYFPHPPFLSQWSF